MSNSTYIHWYGNFKIWLKWKYKIVRTVCSITYWTSQSTSQILLSPVSYRELTYRAKPTTTDKQDERRKVGPIFMENCLSFSLIFLRDGLMEWVTESWVTSFKEGTVMPRAGGLVSFFNERCLFSAVQHLFNGVILRSAFFYPVAILLFSSQGRSCLCLRMCPDYFSKEREKREIKEN